MDRHRRLPRPPSRSHSRCLRVGPRPACTCDAFRNDNQRDRATCYLRLSVGNPRAMGKAECEPSERAWGSDILSRVVYDAKQCSPRRTGFSRVLRQLGRAVGIVAGSAAPRQGIEAVRPNRAPLRGTARFTKARPARDARSLTGHSVIQTSSRDSPIEVKSSRIKSYYLVW